MSGFLRYDPKHMVFSGDGILQYRYCLFARILREFGFHIYMTPNTFTTKPSTTRNSVCEQHSCSNPRHYNMHCHVGAFQYACHEGDRPISRSGEDGILNVMSDGYHGQLWYTTLYKQNTDLLYRIFFLEWRQILFHYPPSRIYWILS